MRAHKFNCDYKNFLFIKASFLLDNLDNLEFGLFDTFFSLKFKIEIRQFYKFSGIHDGFLPIPICFSLEKPFSSKAIRNFLENLSKLQLIFFKLNKIDVLKDYEEILTLILLTQKVLSH